LFSSSKNYYFILFIFKYFLTQKNQPVELIPWKENNQATKATGERTEKRKKERKGALPTENCQS
jgi:hypothetical protein